MPFTRPTRSDLVRQFRTELEGRLPGADSRLRRSLLDALARASAALAHGLYGFLAYIADQPFPDSADEANVRRAAAIYGVPELAAEFAAGSVDLVGTNGAVVLSGTILRRADGTEYETDAEATITGGVATVGVSARTSGVDGNADADVQLTLLATAPGISAVATVATGGIVGGRDPDTVEDLRARVLAHLRRPATGGTAPEYIARVLEYAGVTDVYVYTGQFPDQHFESSIFVFADVEVDGPWIARGSAKRVRLLIPYTCGGLVFGETVTIVGNLQDATDGSGSGVADLAGTSFSDLVFTSLGAASTRGILVKLLDVSAARAFLRSQLTIQTSASGSAIYAGVMELEGVPGAVSIAPLFYDREDPFPTAGEITAIQALVDDPAFRPITAVPVVYALTPQPVNFTIELLGADTPAIRAAVETELQDLFRREATPGGVMLISREREAISLATGEVDHALTAPTANQDLAGDKTKIHVLGTITWL